ncbi:hypothetical protein GN956_G2105 [Arapaima gigas]
MSWPCSTKSHWRSRTPSLPGVDDRGPEEPLFPDLRHLVIREAQCKASVAPGAVCSAGVLKDTRMLNNLV